MFSPLLIHYRFQFQLIRVISFKICIPSVHRTATHSVTCPLEISPSPRMSPTLHTARPIFILANCCYRQPHPNSANNRLFSFFELLSKASNVLIATRVALIYGHAAYKLDSLRHHYHCLFAVFISSTRRKQCLRGERPTQATRAPQWGLWPDSGE